MLKNYEQNRKDAAKTATNVTQSPTEAFAEIMKNPGMALQKLMQQNYA